MRFCCYREDMSLPRALSLLLTVVMLSAVAVFAIEQAADAQELTCPEGTVLSADGTACLAPVVNDNVVTTTTCTVGVLSDDGQTCVVPRLDAPAPAPATPATAAPIPTFTG